MTRIFDILWAGKHLNAVKTGTYEIIATTDDRMKLPLLPILSPVVDMEKIALINQAMICISSKSINGTRKQCLETLWDLASSRGKYTEADIIKAFNTGSNKGAYHMKRQIETGELTLPSVENYIKSLGKPKQVELEMESKFSHFSEDLMKVAVYKDTIKVTDGFVHVVKWIYE